MTDKNTHTNSTVTTTTSVKETGADKVIEKTTGMIGVINTAIDSGIQTQLSAVDTAVASQLKRADALTAKEIKAGVAVALDEAVEDRVVKLNERIENSRYNLNEAKVKLGQADRKNEILTDAIAKEVEVSSELKADLKKAKAERKEFKAEVAKLEATVESKDSEINKLARTIARQEKNIYTSEKLFRAELKEEVALARKEMEVEKTQMSTKVIELELANERLAQQVELQKDIIDATAKMSFFQKVKFIFD